MGRFIDSFPYAIKFKENIVPNALFSKYALLSGLDKKLFGFEHMKDSYAHDLNCREIFSSCAKAIFLQFYRVYGYLFRENKLCIP